MKKQIFFFLVFISVLIVAGCQTQDQTAVKGEVDTVVGDVTLNGTNASVGDDIDYDDLIVTGTNSYCDIVFGKKDMFRIVGNSSVKIDISKNPSIIYIKNGQVAYVMGDLGGKGFVVETDVAVALVRGTVFTVVAEWTNQVYICTCNGSIDFNFGKYGKTNITAAHHVSIRLVKENDGSYAFLPSGLEYHDDEGVEALVDKIGLKIDWTKTDGLSDK
ncbi:MAG: hypothetical protein A2Y33_08755 [Spirochaetes bacterium GWF1_51_8]|nr:MAG: hypothetical protein A2Y33_08755 [Spirochaetes bacterium GWF1_51_8]